MALSAEAADDAAARAQASSAPRPLDVMTTWSILALFLVSRAALLLVGLLTQIAIQPNSTFLDADRLSQRPALTMWGVWDSGWYNSIATGGYDAHIRDNGWANWAFFPAYPLVSAAFARLTHLPVFDAMLAVSNLSFLGALFLIHRETEDAFDRRTADVTVALFCVVPGSYVFSSAYTESLFLLALAVAWRCCRRRRWLAAACRRPGRPDLQPRRRHCLLPLASRRPRHWSGGRSKLASARRAPVSCAALGESARILAALCLPILASPPSPASST